jgi:hypothetical protein
MLRRATFIIFMSVLRAYKLQNEMTSTPFIATFKKKLAYALHLKLDKLLIP